MLSAVEQRRVSELLCHFGCNEREAKIYMQCLSMDPSSVQEIARRTGANRFTVHSAVEQLIGKGLLYETRRGKRRLIVAEDPHLLLRLLEHKHAEVVALSRNVEYAVKLLQSTLPAETSRPSVRFYEGAEGYKRMLIETLSARGEVLVFSYVPLLAFIVGPDHLETYFRKRGRKGIATRLIFPRCAFADRVLKRAKEYHITIRYLPEGTAWQSGIFCWNDCVALLSYTQNRLNCTVIENKDIADFYKKIIFELCWKQGVAS
ncbi:MAG: helix-turn-helix domain-containing protein [Candidatus Peribacteraceae bacterium]|nr:helix-turn-helix domain-containing protein [Candidatus Peribacteraceae bacterium]